MLSTNITQRGKITIPIDYCTFFINPPHSEFFSCRNTFIPTADEQQMYSTYKLHQYISVVVYKPFTNYIKLSDL